MELIIIEKDLCLTDKGKIIKSHKPISRIAEFKRINANCIVVREDTDNYDVKKSNIYCLDNDLKVVWFSDLPFDTDTFPNQIEWDKELNEKSSNWSDYVIDSPNTLTCSSLKGITVSIEYKTGKILKSLFTK